MIANMIAKMIAKMTANRDFSNRLGKSRLSRRVVHALSALLLLGGVAHATPITDLGNNDLQNVLAVRPVDSHLSTRSNLNLATAKAGSEPYLSTSFIPSSQTPSDGCVFSSNCSSMIKVPEPQSLVLVGSGLLSMAGLIRRRLLR